MTIRARRQTKVSKQTRLLDGVDVGPPKQRVCRPDLNRKVHEAMNSISNVKVHLKTRSENVNILFVCLFVCFVALRPKSTAMVIAGRSVHLTTLFPGQA